MQRLRAYASSVGATLPPEGLDMNDLIRRLLFSLVTLAGGTPSASNVHFNDAVNADLTALEAAGGAGGSWTAVTSYDQGSTLQDAGGMLTGGTNAIAADGTITAVPGAAYATAPAGYRGVIPVGTRLLSALVPTYDTSKPDSALEVLLVIQSMPATTAKVGAVIGVVDDVAANQATWNGAVAHLTPNSGTTWNGGVLSAAGNQTSVSQGTTQIDRLWARVHVNPTTRELSIVTACRTTAGNWQTMTSATGAIATATALANLRLVVGIDKQATVTGQPTVQVKAYTRVVRGAATFP